MTTEPMKRMLMEMYESSTKEVEESKKIEAFIDALIKRVYEGDN